MLSGRNTTFDNISENPRDILKQISTLFERGKWDQCNRQSALELLANLSSLERSALIRQSTLLYDSESGDSNGILEIIKTLLRIECPFREDIVQKTLVFIGDTPYRNDEIIKALQIIDGIVEFERPSVLKDLEIALSQKTVPAHIKNIFLDLFGAHLSEDRKYFIAHQLVEIAISFLTPSYQEKNIKDAIRIISRFPPEKAGSIVTSLNRLLPETLSAEDRNQILEAFIGLTEFQTLHLFICVKRDLFDMRGIEAVYIQAEAEFLKKTLPNASKNHS